MTAGFIVRAEFDGRRWQLTLLELATGERRCFAGFDACFAALRETAVRRLPDARRGHPACGDAVDDDAAADGAGAAGTGERTGRNEDGWA